MRLHACIYIQNQSALRLCRPQPPICVRTTAVLPTNKGLEASALQNFPGLASSPVAPKTTTSFLSAMESRAQRARSQEAWVAEWAKGRISTPRCPVPEHLPRSCLPIASARFPNHKPLGKRQDKGRRMGFGGIHRPTAESTKEGDTVLCKPPVPPGASSTLTELLLAGPSLWPAGFQASTGRLRFWF